jgi:DNA-binding beta-propeller fold protein YncE
MNDDVASVTVIDRDTDEAVATIPVGRIRATSGGLRSARSPTSLAVLADGRAGYVSSPDVGTLTMRDGTD